MTLQLHVSSATGAAIVRPAGLLDLTTYAEFRDGLLKCALGEPTAVVVVLDEGFKFATPAVMSVFATVWMRVSEWPGVPVLLVGASPDHRAALAAGGAGRFIPHYEDLATALAAIGDRPDRRRDETWLPDSTRSALMARRFVRETCHRWDVEHLLDDAMLVATELVENAVEHAHSAPNLRLELSGGRLAIAVRDDLAAPPRQRPPDVPEPGGRGIPLIGDVSLMWGHSPWPSGGKVVWALLGE